MCLKTVLALSSRRFPEFCAFLKILQCNTSQNKDDVQGVNQASKLKSILIGLSWLNSASAND